MMKSRCTLKFFIYFLVVFFPLLQVKAAQPVYRLNFQQCVEIALQNNNQIHSNEEDIQVSKAKMIEAHPGFIPVVDYSQRVAPVPGNIDDPGDSFFSGDISVFNNTKVEFGSVLTSFGKIQTAQNLAQLGIDASWFQKAKTTDDVIDKIYQIYQGVLLARNLLDLASQASATINSKVEGMQKGKTVDQLGIVKLKLVLFEIERKVEEAKNKKVMALAALKVQLGLENDVDLDIKQDSLTAVTYNLKPLDTYFDYASTHRPEFKLLGAGIQAKEKKVKLEQLNYAPNLGLGAFVDYGVAPGISGAADENNFTDPFNFTKAGIGMQLKGNFDYVKTSSRVKQAQADLLKTIYDKRAAIRGLQLDVQQSYQDVLSAQHLLGQVEEQIKVAHQLVFLTKSNLDIGVGEKKDYLDALQSYLAFQGRRFEAIYNYNVAVFALQKKTGLLDGTYYHSH